MGRSPTAVAAPHPPPGWALLPEPPKYDWICEKCGKLLDGLHTACTNKKGCDGEREDGTPVLKMVG